jgi:tetratricopeptide (TPR) repeat protein
MTMPAHELEQRLAKADTLYADLALDQAAVAFRDILADIPGCYAAHLGLARTLTRQRDHEGARQAAMQCLALDPDRAEGYLALGVLQFLLDETSEARQSLARALELAPSDPETLLTLAQVTADEGDHESALTLLGEAREAIANSSNENERDALLALAWHAQTYLHLTASDNASAREAAQEVIALGDANRYAASLAYSNLGILEAQQKNYEQAIDYLEQAYEMNPHFYRAASALGRILVLRRQHARAAEVMATVTEHPFSDAAMDRYVYGMALAKSGQRDKAREQYQLALSAGLKGIFRVQALWQTVWLSQWGRYAVIGVALAAVLAYVLLVQPDGSAISLLVVAAVILLMQFGLGKVRR